MPKGRDAQSLYYTWSKEFMEAGKAADAFHTKTDGPLSPRRVNATSGRVGYFVREVIR